MLKAWRVLAALGRAERSKAGAARRQRAWLGECLERNAATRFGRRHRFSALRGPGDFQRAVPLSTYQDVEPWVDLVARGERDVLFSGRAVAFERTSGTTGAGKLIPYSRESLRDFRRAVLPWLADAAESFGLGAGRVYWAISPAARRPQRAPGGAPIGLPDGAYLGGAARASFGALSAVPSGVGALEDVDAWRRATLYWLLRRGDLEMASVWSPTFLTMLLDALAPEADALDRLLSRGGTLSGARVPADAQAAARLRAWRGGAGLRVLWPQLKLVSCWADGSSKPYFEALRRRLPDAGFQAKGLLATEGAVTTPDRQGLPRLAASSGFFEFIDPAGRARLAEELEAGARYEAVMTTAGGLYRYRTGDRVVCEGYVGASPVLRFAGRAGLGSDLVGEKLTEDFVASCLEGIEGFRMLVPEEAAAPPRYALVVEARRGRDLSALAAAAERRLQANPQYAYARRLRQLGPLSPVAAPAPLRRYLDAVGGSQGNAKIPALSLRKGLVAELRGA